MPLPPGETPRLYGRRDAGRYGPVAVSRCASSTLCIHFIQLCFDSRSKLR